MSLAPCDLGTHFAPSPPRPPCRLIGPGKQAGKAGLGRLAGRVQGAWGPATKPELQGSQSVYSVTWFDWIPRLEYANCHIGFLDFPILKHEQMLSSARLSSARLQTDAWRMPLGSTQPRAT